MQHSCISLLCCLNPLLPSLSFILFFFFFLKNQPRVFLTLDKKMWQMYIELLEILNVEVVVATYTPASPLQFPSLSKIHCLQCPSELFGWHSGSDSSALQSSIGSPLPLEQKPNFSAWLAIKLFHSVALTYVSASFSEGLSYFSVFSIPDTWNFIYQQKLMLFLVLYIDFFPLIPRYFLNNCYSCCLEIREVFYRIIG